MVSCLCQLTDFFSKTDVVLSSGICDLCPDWSSANPRHESYIWCGGPRGLLRAQGPQPVPEQGAALLHPVGTSMAQYPIHLSLMFYKSYFGSDQNAGACWCCCHTAVGICVWAALQTLRVRRLYDEQNQTLLYVAYSTRLNGSQNVCPLPLNPSNFRCAHAVPVFAHAHTAHIGFQLEVTLAS